MEVITLWLAVDESSVENGCMRVIPGTQKAVKASMDEAYEAVDGSKNVFPTRLRPEWVEEDKAVNLDLQIGEIHFHDAWTIHGSNPNNSTKRRCGYTMRYMPAHVVFAHGSDWKRAHHIYLLRGEDKTGGQNEYTPVPDF